MKLQSGLLLAFAAFTLSTVSPIAWTSETLKGAEKDYQSFKTEMSQQLDSAEVKIKELRDKAQTNGEATRKSTAEDFERRRQQLQTQLDKQTDVAHRNWKEFKSNFADSVNKLNTHLQKILKD